MAYVKKYYIRRVVAIIILMFMFYVSNFSVNEPQPISLSKRLSDFPMTISKWRMVDSITLQNEMLKMLGADEYFERIYASPDKMVIDIYVSYFNMLKEGKQFHSPKNCLIGAGSTLIKTDKIDIFVPKLGKSFTFNLMLLKKDNIHQFIVYWYQCRGRIITSEYMEKIYRVVDAIYKQRTDGSFIRIICYDQGQGKEASLESLKQFTAETVPHLESILR